MDHTAPASSEKIRKFFRGIGARQVRLVCGMILFAYLISHFLNHALGNISLDALAEGIYYHTLFWQFLPVAIVFYTAAFLHSCLGIWALYQRRQFKWKAMEPLQLALGLSVPLLVAAHIASGDRAAASRASASQCASPVPTRRDSVSGITVRDNFTVQLSIESGRRRGG